MVGTFFVLKPDLHNCTCFGNNRLITVGPNLQTNAQDNQVLPGVLGNRGIMSILFRGTREHKSKNEGNRRTMVISGSREHRKLRF